MKKFISLFAALLLLSITPQLAQAYDEWDILAQTSTGSAAIHDLRVNEYGDVTIGRVVDHFMTVPWPGQPGRSRAQTNVTPDIFYSTDKLRPFIRNMVLEEASKPAEIALRRQEGTYPNGSRVPIISTSVPGVIYWQVWDGNSYYNLGIVGGLSQGRIASIHTRAIGDPSQTSRGGELIFSTGRVGEMSARMTAKITAKGALELWEKGDSKNNVLFWKDDQDTGFYTRGFEQFSLASRGDEIMRIGLEQSNTKTGLWLGANRDGVRDTVQVQIGPPDSAGPGYRKLTILN